MILAIFFTMLVSLVITFHAFQVLDKVETTSVTVLAEAFVHAILIYIWFSLWLVVLWM